MKPKIHPKYYNDVKVTCACGNSWTTGSTKPSLNVEICASCHPFFTGKAKLLDTAGRVDRYKARLERSRQMATVSQKRVLKKEQAALAKSKAKTAANNKQVDKSDKTKAGAAPDAKNKPQKKSGAKNER